MGVFGEFARGVVNLRVDIGVIEVELSVRGSVYYMPNGVWNHLVRADPDDWTILSVQHVEVASVGSTPIPVPFCQSRKHFTWKMSQGVEEEPVDEQLTKIQEGQTKGKLMHAEGEDIRGSHCCSLGMSDSAEIAQ